MVGMDQIEPLLSPEEFDRAIDQLTKLRAVFEELSLGMFRANESLKGLHVTLKNIKDQDGNGAVE